MGRTNTRWISHNAQITKIKNHNTTISSFSLFYLGIQKRCDRLSLERIIETLESFGFERKEAEVYVYLGKKGPKEVKGLAEALKIKKRQLKLILKKLQSKGVVTASYERATVYSALDFEKTLDLLEKENIQKTKAIRKTLEKFKSN